MRPEMNTLDLMPKCESSVVIPFRGYSEDKANMESIAEMLSLKSASASPRVSMRVLRSIVKAIKNDPILAEFLYRVTVNTVIQPKKSVIQRGPDRRAS